MCSYFNVLNAIFTNVRRDNMKSLSLQCVENNKDCYRIDGAWDQNDTFIKCNVQNKMKRPLFKKRTGQLLFKML